MATRAAATLGAATAAGSTAFRRDLAARRPAARRAATRRVVASSDASGPSRRGTARGDLATPSTSTDSTRVSPAPSRARALGRAPRRAILNADWSGESADGSADGSPDSDDDAPRDAARDPVPVPVPEDRSSSSSSRSSSSTSSPSPSSSSSSGPSGDTELVMVLERRGEGWAEEVFPHVVLKRRPVAPSSASARRATGPDPAQAYLESRLGLTRDDAMTTVSAAAAWRVTRGGRALVDRKIMRMVQNNAATAVEAMIKLGVRAAQAKTLILETPQLLGVDPADDWNRCLLEYVVRTKVPGGGKFGKLKLKMRKPAPKSMNQAEQDIERREEAERRKASRAKNKAPAGVETGLDLDASDASARGAGTGTGTGTAVGKIKSSAARSDPLREWVEDVRDKRQCGRLSQEQLYLLDVAGFDASVMESKAGDSKRTWEMWFDELVEYQVATGTCEIPEERQDAGLGRWLDRQRRKNAKGTLPLKAYTRLHALGVSFEGFEAPASATEPTEQDERMIIDSAAAMVKLRRAAPLDMAPRGPGEEEWADDPALDRKSVDMVRSLLDFQRREGRFVEPPLGSPLAVWLSRTRARAASEDPDGPHGAMSPEERAALEKAGVELENFSASWLTELERFASLRAHRVTLHDPIALAAFEREQRELSFAGALSRARLLRLRQAGMKGLRCTSEDDEELFRGAPENRRPPLFGVHRPLAGQIETISMRENVLAAEAAAAAREEAKRTAEGDARVERRRPPARARSRPARTVIAGGATTTTTAKTKTRRRAARDVDKDGERNGDGDGDGDGEGDVEDIVSTAVTSTSTRA